MEYIEIRYGGIWSDPIETVWSSKDEEVDEIDWLLHDVAAHPERFINVRYLGGREEAIRGWLVEGLRLASEAHVKAAREVIRCAV